MDIKRIIDGDHYFKARIGCGKNCDIGYYTTRYGAKKAIKKRIIENKIDHFDANQLFIIEYEVIEESNGHKYGACIRVYVNIEKDSFKFKDIFLMERYL